MKQRTALTAIVLIVASFVAFVEYINYLEKQRASEVIEAPDDRIVIPTSEHEEK